MTQTLLRTREKEDAFVRDSHRHGLRDSTDHSLIERRANLSFRHSQGMSGLIEIESEWQALTDGAANLAFYQCPALARAYIEHLAPDPDALIWVSGWRDGKLALILSLERAGSNLRLLWHDHMTLSDVLAPELDCETWPDFWTWLCSSDGPGGYSLIAPALLADAVLERWLINNPVSSSLVRDQDGSAWLDCARSYDELLKAASGNHRSNLSRGLKRAAQRGALRYETHTGVTALLDAMQHFLSVEASGWKGAEGGAVACNPELVAFYISLCKTLGAHGRCEIDLLWLGTKPIATVFWFRTGGVLHLQKIAYLEEFSNLGPGRLIMASALQRACADPGLHRVSFITRCPWADGWRTQITSVRERVLYPTTLAGRLAHALARARENLKKHLHPQVASS